MSRATWTPSGGSGGGPKGPLPGVGWGAASVIALVVLPFLVAWLGLGPAMMTGLSLIPAEAGARPWAAFTYVLADPGGFFFGALLSGLWAYYMGTSLERELRGAMLPVLYGVFALIGGLSVLVGGLLLAPAFTLWGTMIPLGALTVLWATRNPDQSILLMMIIPVKAKILGWVTALGVLFTVGTGSPLMGLFALVPLGAAWAYASNRVPGLRFGQDLKEVKAKKKESQEFNQYIDNVRQREQEREERERLRRLFEASVKDDPDDKR